MICVYNQHENAVFFISLFWSRYVLCCAASTGRAFGVRVTT